MYLSRAYLAAGAIALGALLAAASPARAANFTVNVNDNLTFTPQVVTIQVGDSVTWSSNGFLLHNVRADDGGFRCANGCDGQGGNGNPAAVWSFTLTFDDPGTIAYFCEVHGAAGGFGMAGQVVVQGGGGSPGSLRFSQPTYSVGEGAGSATITVQRVNGDDGAASVQYATSNGSATAGADYGATSGTLNWADDDDDSKTFTVSIVDDAANEGNETVNLTLSGATGASLGSPSQATLRILDDDAPSGEPGSLQFAGASHEVSEGAGSATLTVHRTGGAGGAVSVDYGTADGTAAAGSDYTSTSGTLSWSGGDAEPKSFDVPILDDEDDEEDEAFEALLSNPGGGATLGSPSAAAVTIRDNDVDASFPCQPDDLTLCLLGDRFQVRVSFTRPNGMGGNGRVIPFTDKAGLFYFFSQANLEMLVKMVDGCGLNGKFWVFYAATTNVEFTVTVTDTLAGEENVYSNPLGMAAAPIQDTGAFVTCP